MINTNDHRRITAAPNINWMYSE